MRAQAVHVDEVAILRHQLQPGGVQVQLAAPQRISLQQRRRRRRRRVGGQQGTLLLAKLLAACLQRCQPNGSSPSLAPSSLALGSAAQHCAAAFLPSPPLATHLGLSV